MYTYIYISVCVSIYLSVYIHIYVYVCVFSFVMIPLSFWVVVFVSSRRIPDDSRRVSISSMSYYVKSRNNRWFNECSYVFLGEC